MSEEMLYKTRSEVTNYLSDSYMLNIITDVIDNNIELLREYKQLQQENQQLKENNKSIMEELLRVVGLYNQQKSVLDEIREYIESNKRVTSSHFNGKEYVFINYWLECDPNDLLKILDKVKE